MTHEPIHSDPSWAPDLPLGDPALVNQPQVIEDRIRSFSAWVLQQAMVADEWTFGSPSAEWLALWLQSNPVWIAERSSYSDRTKEQILKGIMQALVDYQRQALDGKTAGARRQADEKVHETVLFRGIPVAVEFPKGSTRKGVDPQGVPWEKEMMHDYGHFSGIPAVDGDSLDCYIGPDETSDLVFVVDQWKADGSLDEYKTLLGFTTAEEALKGYLVHMPSDWTRYGSLQPMSLKEFRDEWLQTPNTWAAKIARRAALATPPEKSSTPWVSTEGDKAVAHLGDAEATVLVQPDKARGIVDNIWVPADLRSSGVGTMLMLALAEWCKEHGILYLTGLDVSDNRESSKIRKKLPGKSVLFRRNTENQPGETGADVFPDAPEALKNVLQHFVPDESGAVMVTKLARALRASLAGAPQSGSQFNAELKEALGQTEHLKQAGGDEGPDLGEHGASTDGSGKFWGSAGSGCVVVAKSTGRMLLSYRSEFVNEPHTWGVWGGAIDAGEDPKESAARELREETGYTGDANLIEAYVFEDGDFRYTTYIAFVPEEFMPKLNWEAEGYQWCRIGEYPDPLHFGLKEALPAIESKLGESDDEEPKGKTSSATYTIPPRIAKATSAPGGLASASQWTTKVWLGNSGTKDHTEVTLVAFDPTTSTVVPIAGSDEHKGGWELINYLVSRKIIPDLPYVVIALGVNFVDTSNPKEVAQCLTAWTAWRRLQGMNTAVRSRYAQDGQGFLVSMDDFIRAEGNPRKTMVPGKLSAPGERLVKALDALSALYSKQHLKGIVPEKLLVRAGANLMEALNHIQYAYILGYQDLQHAKSALSDMEAGGDPAEFERAIFTANGLKNQIHNALRSYGSNQFKDMDLRDTFGDVALAKSEFDRMGNAPGVTASAREFQQIVVARFHGRKTAADEDGALDPSDYYSKTVQVLKEGIPTFDGFVAKLRTSLQDRFSDYLRAAGGYTGLRRIWDLTLGDQEEDHKRSLNDMRISPRRPWAKEAPNGKEREVPLDDPFGETRLQPDLASVSRSPEKLAKNVSLMETYPNFQGLAGTQMDASQKAEAIITQMEDNLIWLYNHWSPDFRDHTKLWYVGGNRLAHRWAERFKVDPHKVAAVIATLSPQQPWFQNITLAERVLTAVTEHPDMPWDPAMTKLIKTRDWGRKATLGRTSPLHMLKELEGKSLRDLKAEGTPDSLYKQAVWIRAWDEAHNPNRLRKCTPDGEFGNWDTNDNGALSKVQWKSFDMIGKAIQAVESSSIQEISEVVGEGHKVRSFYNNLVAPHSDGGDVTIDTHAVAAALLRPLSASSREVSHNFGSNVTGEPGPAADSEAGVKGTYGFYAEAYRRAAKKLGVLPRELQSITWEAVRGLFEVKIKGTNGEKTQGAIQKTWEDVSRGKLNAATARERISALAGGITAPGWAVADDADVDLPRDSSYTGELSGDVRPGSGPGELPSGTGGGTPGRAASLRSRLFRRA